MDKIKVKCPSCGYVNHKAEPDAPCIVCRETNEDLGLKDVVPTALKRG